MEIAVLAAIFAATVWASARMQQVTVTRYWDGDEYYVMAEQMAAGQAPRAAAPYVYRLATPWLVARLWPASIVTGFRAINLSAAAAAALLLLVWLRRLVAERWARILVVALFIIEWHGPARFVSYYPVYVDPLVFPFLLAGLILIDLLREPGGATATRIGLLTIVCVAGALCREVMIVVPVALLFGRYPVLPGGSRLGDAAPGAWFWLPLGATIATLAAARTLVHPRLLFSWIETAIFHLRHKPAYTWLLAWFITFGPVLALVFSDWRRAWRTLAERQELAACLAMFGVLAYVGGHDTERYLFWSMPVVYLLVARALVARRVALSGTYLAAMLVVGQAVSARVFWAIPSPGFELAALADMPTRAAKLYSILNRLFVIDDFHWNLWSNFGSRPFHALLLAIYLVFSGAMIGWIHVRATRIDAF